MDIKSFISKLIESFTKVSPKTTVVNPKEYPVNSIEKKYSKLLYNQEHGITIVSASGDRLNILVHSTSPPLRERNSDNMIEVLPPGNDCNLSSYVIPYSVSLKNLLYLLSTNSNARGVKYLPIEKKCEIVKIFKSKSQPIEILYDDVELYSKLSVVNKNADKKLLIDNYMQSKGYSKDRYLYQYVSSEDETSLIIGVYLKGDSWSIVNDEFSSVMVGSSSDSIDFLTRLSTLPLSPAMEKLTFDIMLVVSVKSLIKGEHYRFTYEDYEVNEQISQENSVKLLNMESKDYVIEHVLTNKINNNYSNLNLCLEDSESFPIDLE